LALSQTSSTFYTSSKQEKQVKCANDATPTLHPDALVEYLPLVCLTLKEETSITNLRSGKQVYQ
jgi:hypothetical protein